MYPATEKLTISPTADKDYTLHIGILRYKGKIHVCNDPILKQQIMESLHTSPVGVHSGIVASYQKIKGIFHWTGMKKDITTFITECPICQRAKGETCHYPGLLQPLEKPDMAFTHITMEFVEGLPKSNGKEVIMVIVDRFTKFAHFIPLAHLYTFHIVAQAFLDTVFTNHGPPLCIV